MNARQQVITYTFLVPVLGSAVRENRVYRFWGTYEQALARAAEMMKWDGAADVVLETGPS
jgi:hypothetical protein